MVARKCYWKTYILLLDWYMFQIFSHIWHELCIEPVVWNIELNTWYIGRQNKTFLNDTDVHFFDRNLKFACLPFFLVNKISRFNKGRKIRRPQGVFKLSVCVKMYVQKFLFIAFMHSFYDAYMCYISLTMWWSKSW